MVYKKDLQILLKQQFKLSDGLLVIENLDTNEQKLFSEKFSDPYSDFTLPEIEPRLFSFNSHVGACDTCSGLGVESIFDKDLLIPNKDIPLSKGAIEPLATHKVYKGYIKSVCAHFKQSYDSTWNELSEECQDALLNGSKEPIEIILHVARRKYKKFEFFEGIRGYLKRRQMDNEKNWGDDSFTKYQVNRKCSSCHGKRLRLEALCVKINECDISQVSALSIVDAYKWFEDVFEHLTKQQQGIAERIVKEIKDRLKFLISVGLNYLNLDRTSGTLSGGESQRIRLASQIGSGLTGVLYVLDEPSIGLHQRDNDRLLASLKHLKSLDNTIIVVEHDEDAIRFADYLIDMGPRAGIHGGEIVACGTPKQVMKNTKSTTAQYLTGKKKISVPKKFRKGNGEKITITGVTTNNLKNVTASIPLGTFTSVTGVSGGGKSSLIVETLWKGIEKELGHKVVNIGEYKSISGVEHIDKIIDINQAPIGRTPRSNPATYTGVFNHIREWFAKLPESKARGYKPGRFSFNVKGGRCEACKGDGVIKVEMHFLPDVYVECDQCKGKRYNRESLEVKYKGKNISNVLEMTVDEALEFFIATPPIKRILTTLQDVGLGYIHLGQQATTLSGGEAQRVKLAKELAKRDTGQTFYILDEPTTGLHFDDIKQLLEVLHKLVDHGNTVVVIEHNLDVIKTSDHIIDIGPEGGAGGGEIVAIGTPPQIAKSKKSFTAKYLKRLL